VQQRFIPANYIVHVSLTQALEKVRMRDGKPWNVRAVSNADIKLQVIVPVTAEQRAKAHVQDGNAAKLAGDYGQAIKEFEAALQATPADVSLHGPLGGAYLDAGRFREAAEHLELAMPALKGETRSPLFQNLAYAYVRLGDFARARATLSKMMSSQDAAAEVERMRTR
jgi:Flp pilus assembly protein TadD